MKEFTIRMTPKRVTGDFGLFEGDRRHEDITGEHAIRVSRSSKELIFDYLSELDAEEIVVHNETGVGQFDTH
jgi:hypothetical protein